MYFKVLGMQAPLDILVENFSKLLAGSASKKKSFEIKQDRTELTKMETRHYAIETRIGRAWRE